MTWLPLVLLAGLAMLPFAVSMQRTARPRGRREAALTLHHAQLVELDCDMVDGQIGAAEHASATLEIQRRLLSAAASPEELPCRAGQAPQLIALVAVPLTALALYLAGGSPGMLGFRSDTMVAQTETEPRGIDASMAKLGARVAALDAASDTARAGYRELGKAESGQKAVMDASVSWIKALMSHPKLAVVTAEALTEAVRHGTVEVAALFRRALNGGKAAQQSRERP